MTSPYLLMRKRELSEIDEGGQGDASTEQVDELQFLADKTVELLQIFYRRQYASEATRESVMYLEDIISVLKTAARDIAERERNER